jgi:hypothetical protein
MKKLQLAFTASNSPFSWLIRFFTWSPYSHVDFYDQEAGILIGAIPLKGVVARPAEKVFRDSSKVAIYEVDVDSEVVSSIIRREIGKSYDWSAIFGFLFKRDWEKPDRWECSELVSYCVLKAGKVLFNERLNRITPRDLVINPFLKLIKD